MELLKVYKDYDLETVRDTLNILDKLDDSKNSILDSYCPEIVHEPSMVYSQRSLKTRSFRIRQHVFGKIKKVITVNMVYRSEHETEPDDKAPIMSTIRFSRLYIPAVSLYGRLLLKLFVSQLFIDGITPAVILTMYATRCKIYGGVTFVEHVKSPVSISKFEPGEALSVAVQMLALFDVLELNGIFLMDPDPEDFVLTRFRPRPSFRNLDMSITKSVRYVFNSGDSIDVPLVNSRFVRMINEFPVKLMPPGEHAIVPDVPIRRHDGSSMIDMYSRLMRESGITKVEELADLASVSSYEEAISILTPVAEGTVSGEPALIVSSRLLHDPAMRLLQK